MDSNHSPGPFRIHESAGIEILDATGQKIASVLPVPESPDQRVMNARLFRAAPELLKQLIEVHDNVSYQGPISDRIKALIKEVTHGR